ncbi:transmembrane protein 104-like isoform X1 [Leptotrombidium deliense]|uniref:Transmembrane protein 104-like isoform X1 n=1 Tax=Leptotrombidium deliense TaxID=299467 RepID=A0A443STF0_9ACAR|nr:transmembrane protein 104-like isoform X1 [Leptotrombidium deliense]
MQLNIEHLGRQLLDFKFQGVFAVTLMYLFNINVGTAVLAMPIAFQQTGWLLSTFILTIICFISRLSRVNSNFVTVTFQIECVSIANAVSYLMKTKPELFNDGLVEKPQEEDDTSVAITNEEILEEKPQEEDDTSVATTNEEILEEKAQEADESSAVVIKEDISERTAVKESQITYGTVKSMETAESNIEEKSEDIFEMRQSFDLTDVADLFLEKFGRIIFQTLTTFKHINPAIALTDSDPCWHSMGITRGQSYRVFVLIVFLALGPFTFCKIENTLLFQVFSSLFRITVFVVMISLTITSMVTGKAEGAPVMANIWSVPSLIGIAIYGFICQHAFPSVISSISNKKHLMWSTFAGYLLILSFYFLLSYTAIFTFPYLKDVYTLNFMNNRCKQCFPLISACDENEYSVIPRVMFLELLIPLYPVIAFSTNLQINSITLKNSLLSLLTSCSDPCQTEATATFNQKVVLPLLAVIPPFVIAMITTDMVMLISVVGIYAGLLAQCVIPSMLLISSRKTVNIYCEKNEEFQNLMNAPNKYKSPFSHPAVLYFMFIWSLLCIVCITVALIL